MQIKSRPSEGAGLMGRLWSDPLPRDPSGRRAACRRGPGSVPDHVDVRLLDRPGLSRYCRPQSAVLTADQGTSAVRAGRQGGAGIAVLVHDVADVAVGVEVETRLVVDQPGR